MVHVSIHSHPLKCPFHTSYEFDLWLHFNLINFLNINFFFPSSMVLVHGPRSPFIQFHSFFRCWMFNGHVYALCLYYRNGKAPKCLKMKWKHVLYHFCHFFPFFLPYSMGLFNLQRLLFGWSLMSSTTTFSRVYITFSMQRYLDFIWCNRLAFSMCLFLIE